MENEEIGALWEKTSSKGNKFMTGTVDINGEKHRIVCFKNGKKSKDTQPDWRILISEPPQRQGTSITEAADDVTPF